MKSRKIVFVRANSFRSEPRLIKEYSAAEKYNRYMILWNRDSVFETMDKTYIMKISAPFGQLKFILYLPIWFIFTFFQLCKIKPDIIHACDLACVIPSYFFKSFFRKTKLIYDIWDATIGHFPTKRRWLRRIIINSEKYFIAKSDIVLVPDKERMIQLDVTDSKLVEKIIVIYNSDLSSEGKRELNFKGKKIRVTYVGVMSKQIRGLEQIIYAAKMLPDIMFKIAGYGPDGEYLHRLFSRANLKNVEYLGRISHEEAEKLNKSSDIMISLLDDQYDNYRFATSTKVFEAFKLLKPVITTKYSATGNLVSRVGWGEVIDYNEAELVRCLKKIQSGEITFRLDSKRVAEYSWEHMAWRLNSAYDYLLGASTKFEK